MSARQPREIGGRIGADRRAQPVGAVAAFGSTAARPSGQDTSLGADDLLLAGRRRGDHGAGYALPDLRRRSSEFGRSRITCRRRWSTTPRAEPARSEQGSSAAAVGRVSMRIGIDLGGTKIEGIALDDRRPRARPAAGGHAGRRLRGDDRRRSSPWSPTSRPAPARWPRVGVGIPGAVSPATGLVKNANATWLIGRPLDRDLARRARPAGARRQRRQLLRRLRGDRRRGRRCRGGLRRHPRHRRGRRHRRRRPGNGRRQRHRRRVGPQPAAVAGGRRAAGARLLLRPGAAASRPSSAAPASPATTAGGARAAATLDGARDRRPGAGRRAGGRGGAGALRAAAWRARWRR